MYFYNRGIFGGTSRTSFWSRGVSVSVAINPEGTVGRYCTSGSFGIRSSVDCWKMGDALSASDRQEWQMLEEDGHILLTDNCACSDKTETAKTYWFAPHKQDIMKL